VDTVAPADNPVIVVPLIVCVSKVKSTLPAYADAPALKISAKPESIEIKRLILFAF
jgi:hypothetical protein